MKKFIVYFEIGGHKMKMKVTAPTDDSAKESVKKKIIFHKVKRSVFDDESISQFEKIFGELLK